MVMGNKSNRCLFFFFFLKHSENTKNPAAKTKPDPQTVPTTVYEKSALTGLTRKDLNDS